MLKLVLEAANSSALEELDLSFSEMGPVHLQVLLDFFARGRSKYVASFEAKQGLVLNLNHCAIGNETIRTWIDGLRIPLSVATDVSLEGNPIDKKLMAEFHSLLEVRVMNRRHYVALIQLNL